MVEYTRVHWTQNDESHEDENNAYHDHGGRQVDAMALRMIF